MNLTEMLNSTPAEKDGYLIIANEAINTLYAHVVELGELSAAQSIAYAELRAEIEALRAENSK